MDKKQVYRGVVKTGRGEGAAEMAAPDDLEGFRRLVGLDVIPGTLNIDLTEPLDLALLKYASFAELGWEFDPAKQGIKYEGEIGMYYGRVVVAEKYPAGLIFFSWVTDPTTDAELVSSHHLRSALGLRDGDIVEFTVD